MIITKITSILPEEFKHFSSAWDSTTEEQKTVENLTSRLMLEEEKSKTTKEESVAFKATTTNKHKNKDSIKCFICKDKGHSMKNCPKATVKKCSICKKSNHEEKDFFST